ncbi:hypothetical protein TNCV_3379931 [Trichonephila clavipes]|nr:hypothetical protein TNCV_3379931 [Trichonephila clavipes]
MGGFITFIDETPISWRTFKQKSVSLSTMEAEYVSLTEAAKGIHLAKESDTEGRKTKGRLQTNPGTWGFQMFPEEEMQDIGEQGNQTSPRIHFTSHNIKHGG